MPSLLVPRLWGAHLVALAALAVTVNLGLWQLDSWQAERQAQAADLTRLTPEPLGEVLGPDDPFPGDQVGQPVVVAGTWVPDGTVYVSGREDEGRDGFWVVTPLAVGGPEAPALPIVPTMAISSRSSASASLTSSAVRSTGSTRPVRSGWWRCATSWAR